jgi:hypothetical protein
MPRPDAPAEILLPRGLILLGAAWLIGSWLLSVGISPPVLPSAASYTPAVRSMLLNVGLGLFVAWPLIRLSQPLSPMQRWRSGTIVALDLAVLISLTHVVVWPLRLVTTWPPERSLAIATHFAAWSMLFGAIACWAMAHRRPHVRTSAMLLCLAFVGVGPALLALGRSVPEWLERLSPLLRLWRLMTPDSGTVAPQAWIDIAVTGVAGVLGLWAAAISPFRDPPPAAARLATLAASPSAPDEQTSSASPAPAPAPPAPLSPQ